jgi:hypothetical protein
MMAPLRTTADTNPLASTDTAASPQQHIQAPPGGLGNQVAEPLESDPCAQQAQDTPSTQPTQSIHTTSSTTSTAAAATNVATDMVTTAATSAVNGNGTYTAATSAVNGNGTSTAATSAVNGNGTATAANAAPIGATAAAAAASILATEHPYIHPSSPIPTDELEAIAKVRSAFSTEIYTRGFK